jgi:hypothetical protein
MGAEIGREEGMTTIHFTRALDSASGDTQLSDRAADAGTQPTWRRSSTLQSNGQPQIL